MDILLYGVWVFFVGFIVLAFILFFREKASKVKNNSAKGGQQRTITETKNTCNACGKVWYYGKQEVAESTGAAMQNIGKSMSCCSGCLPAVFIPDKKVIDLNKCPECGSRAITKGVVTHEV